MWHSTVVNIYIMGSVMQIVGARDTNAHPVVLPERPKMCVVVFVASASLRLCSSNLALAISSGEFFQDVLTCPLSTNHCSTRIWHTSRWWDPSNPRCTLLFSSCVVLQQETERKLSWSVTPEYDAYDAARVKHYAHFTSSATGNGAVFGLLHIKSMPDSSNSTVCPTFCETGRWKCLSQ